MNYLPYYEKVKKKLFLKNMIYFLYETSLTLSHTHKLIFI